MSASERQGFLDAILEEPDNDGHRLIFADWLDENGDPERAEFIRVQCELESLPKWDVRYLPLKLREIELLCQHEEDWRADLPEIRGVYWGEYRRGFMATAEMSSFAVLRLCANECWAATPLETVGLPWPYDDDRSESIDPIPGLRGLNFESQVVDFRGLNLLTESPLLSTLRELNVSACALSPFGFSELMQCQYLENLRVLRAPSNLIGNGGIIALCENHTLSSLEELDLSETLEYGHYQEDATVDASAMEVLAQWEGLKGIHVLNLSGHAIGADGLYALLDSQYVTALKSLTLRNCEFTGLDLEAFIDAQESLRLDVLDLGDNLLPGDGIENLSDSSCVSELAVLALDRCELQRASLRALAEAPFLSSLRKLNLSFNHVEPDELRLLLERSPEHLHSLHLFDNNLGNKGVELLAESPASNVFQQLDLGMNRLSGASAHALQQTKYLQNLLVLRLNYNLIGQTDSEELRNSPFGKRLAGLFFREETDINIPS